MTDSEKMDLLLEKMSCMESRMTNMEAKMSNMESKMSNMESKVSNMESKMSNMESEVSDIKTNNAELGKNITSIKLTLENEIRVNIQRVAEGHLDLSRNLHEAMRPSNEIEMLSIRVRALESEVRDLKRQIS